MRGAARPGRRSTGRCPPVRGPRRPAAVRTARPGGGTPRTCAPGCGATCRMRTSWDGQCSPLYTPGGTASSRPARSSCSSVSARMSIFHPVRRCASRAF
ncbi:hypothetical protein [Ornithinimicrobium kibberense]|uniref:hypothetical protein n=1 Tax=Ornithinimicrobium kibberense TaxID=282060 RepID=UPI0036158C8B